MKTLGFIFLLSLIVASCEPERSEQNSDHSIIGKWKAVSLEELENGSWVDYYADLELCEKDDFIEFTSLNEFVFHTNSDKCDPLEPSSAIVGNWSQPTARSLKIQSDYVEFENFIIEQLDNTVLQIYGKDGQDEIRMKFTRVP